MCQAKQCSLHHSYGQETRETVEVNFCVSLSYQGNLGVDHIKDKFR